VRYRINIKARQEMLEELGMALIMPFVQQRYEDAAYMNFKNHKRSKIKLLMFFLDKHFNGV
jgi:hypothetical protein